MKTIGMIGGMSWKSTLEYYRIMNETVKERLGGHHSCDCLIYSVDFGPIKDLQFAGDWDKLTELMVDAAVRLKKGGAEIMVICTNTMHKMAPEIEKATAIPLIHIADATAAKIKAARLTKVLLLGTRFTMEQDFYRGRLSERHGIEVLTPDSEDMNTIHNIIYNELVMGIIKDESRDIFLHIIRKMSALGAEGLILGCTEIPLLIKAEDSPLPVFDTTTIHAVNAVELALS